MNRVKKIAILGGGPAGLAAGYYARRRNLPFSIFEAREIVGGNAAGFEHRGFRVEPGVHRLRDRDGEATAELRNLLGDDLVRTAVAGQVHHRGKLIDFPPSPLAALMKLGPGASVSAALAVVRARLRPHRGDPSFRAAAVRCYGEAIARRFVVSYSEKLWGLSSEQLSPGISDKPSTGSTAGTFFTETPHGNDVKTAHADGSLYCSKRGYGTIVEKLAVGCGEHRIHRNAPVTRLVHDRRRIVAVEAGGGAATLEPSIVISTLPLGTLVRALDPRPPARVFEAGRELRFRNLLLVAFFLDAERVTSRGWVCFPDPEFPMTRVCEPNHRSPLMSPPGKSSLVAEVPCDPAGEPWSLSDAAIVRLVQPHLERIGWVQPERLIGCRVYRLARAYPVPRLGFEDHVHTLLEYLGRFENLRLSGQNGRHACTHLADQLLMARDLIDAEAWARASRWRRPARLPLRSFAGPVGVHPANPP
jgi:protoporphyrinogen oxidase